MIVLGIDPGLTGAISAIDTATGIVTISDMPTVDLIGTGMVRRRVDGLALARAIRALNPADECVAVYLEHMQAHGGGKNKGAAATEASLMRTYGAIEAVLDVLRIKPQCIPPRTWKRMYDLKGGTEGKEQALEMARTLYPQAQGYLKRKLDHNRGESLLLAHYGRTKEN